MKLDAEFTTSRLPAILRRQAAAAERLRQEALSRIGEDLFSALRQTAPVASGDYRDSVEIRVTPGAVHVGSSHPHAPEIERGRRPGSPPPSGQIAAAYGLDRRAAFAVARAIGRSGTDGHFPVRRAAAAAAGRAAAHARRALVDLKRLR